jgi:hypothetical protein
MVLASGEIVDVTYDLHPDLYWAMRGGGMNFGIVTRFEFETFEQGHLWGGTRSYTGEHEGNLLTALDKFNRTGSDTDAEACLISAYVAQAGGLLYTAIISHSNPEDEPAVFDDFKALPHVFSSTALRSLTDLSIEIDRDNLAGYRLKTTSQAIKSDLATLKEIAAIHMEELEPLKDVKDFLPALLFQPLTPAMLPKDDIGNTLGIIPEDGPLFGKTCPT